MIVKYFIKKKEEEEEHKIQAQEQQATKISSDKEEEKIEAPKLLHTNPEYSRQEIQQLLNFFD